MADDSTGPDGLKCARCAAAHTLLACPYVKAIDFEYGYVDGAESASIRRVEFLTPADYGRAAPAAAPEQDYPKLGSR